MQRSSSSVRFVGRSNWPQLLLRRHVKLYSTKKDMPGENEKLATGRSDEVKKTSGKIPTPGNVIRFEFGKRTIRRENNMWRDPHELDTKWLSPRDPNRYKPDFGQTEPQSLREQFMRSPDQRTRDAMTRDWEKVMRIAANNKRLAKLAEYKQQRKQLPSDPKKTNRRSNNK